MNSSIDGVPRDMRSWTRQSSGLALRMLAGIGFNLVGAGFNQGSTFVVNLVVANLLGREAFGRYTMVLATVAAVATVSQLSMGYTATKHIAEFRVLEPVRAGRILSLCAAVAVASGLLAALSLVLSAGWLATVVLDAPDLAPLLRLAAIAVFATVLIGFVTGGLAGLEEYALLAKTGIVSGSAYIVVCVALAGRFGLTGAVAGIALSAVLQAVLLGIVLIRATTRAGVAMTRRGCWIERSLLWKFAFPASLTALLHLPATWTASALLAQQAGGYQQLALFGAASSFRTMVLFLPQAINNVGMSLLNNQRRASAEGFARVFWMNTALSTGAAFAAAAVLFLAATPLLHWFGPSFGAGRTVLRILLAAAILEAVSAAVYQIIVSRSRMWASVVLVSLPRDAAILLIAAALVPQFGADGLATAHAVGWALSLLAILALASRLGVGASAAAHTSTR